MTGKAVKGFAKNVQAVMAHLQSQPKSYTNMMTAALTVACLFGQVADASVFNLIAPSDDRKTFHTAYTVDDTTSLAT